MIKQPRLIVLLVAAIFPATAQLPSTPQNPPVFSAITAIFQDGSIDPLQSSIKGPIEEAKVEEFNTVDKSSAPRKSTTTKYDNQQRVIEQITEEANGNASKTTRLYKGALLQSETTEWPGKTALAAAWRRWTYDSAGRVVDLGVGRGSTSENHFLNYKYDASGRPVSWEYRQGAADQFFDRTDIKYSGNTVVTNQLDNAGDSMWSQIQVLDKSGRVADLKVFESGKLWYHVAFLYDEQGRVIEQQTDPYKFGVGDDDSPLPGKVITQFDDAKHLREQKYYLPEGQLSYHSIALLDHDGNILSLRRFSSAGAEPTGSELFPNQKTKAPEIRAGETVWEVSYDDKDNWIQRRKWFTPADGSARMLMETIRRTIRYR